MACNKHPSRVPTFNFTTPHLATCWDILPSCRPDCLLNTVTFTVLAWSNTPQCYRVPQISALLISHYEVVSACASLCSTTTTNTDTLLHLCQISSWLVLHRPQHQHRVARGRCQFTPFPRCPQAILSRRTSSRAWILNQTGTQLRAQTLR